MKYLTVAFAVVVPFVVVGFSIWSLAHGETKLSFDFGGTPILSISVVLNVYFLGNSRALKRAHKDTVERLTAAPLALEKVIDPHRSSSRLTQRGETPPEDHY